MTHRFSIKEIARQSGLSTATIDRVINNRPNVSSQTKARVAAAISELEGQEGQLAARGRRMFFDFLIEAPVRFSREVKLAAEQVLPRIDVAVCRPRFVFQEIMEEDEVLKSLARIAKRGSQGVCLKVRDLPAIREAVDRLISSGIPVVTLVTDLTNTKRIAYAGLDNQRAGRIAAYLIAKTVGNVTGTVLTSRSNDRFLGEEEREANFVTALQELCPKLRCVDVSGGGGIHFETSRLMPQVIAQLDHVFAVYSMGGGNKTILSILDQNRFSPAIFIAHDLDRDNTSLIEKHKISFVLHHDLRIDLENVFRAFLYHHKLLANAPSSMISNIQIITPENIPV